MVKLIVYFAHNPKDQNNLTREEIIVEDQVAVDIGTAVSKKNFDKDEVAKYFSNIKDIAGKTHNIDFDKVAGFEFNRA